MILQANLSMNCCSDMKTGGKFPDWHTREHLHRIAAVFPGT